MNFIRTSFLELKAKKFAQKIRKIEDYLNDEPGGHLSKVLSHFKVIVEFIKKIKKLENLDKFFKSGQSRALVTPDQFNRESMIRINTSLQQICTETAELRHIAEAADQSKTSIRKKIARILDEFKVVFDRSQDFAYR